MSSRTDRPNILVLMSDQHNSRVMGCAGDPWVATPNLDRLASEGAQLSNVYCPSPLCAPSRMSFMAGLTPTQTGVMTNEQIPSSARPTIAHAAGAVGYRPWLAGKMHALGPDQLQGFAGREVGDHGPNYQGASRPTARGVLEGAAGPNLASLRKIGPGRNAYQVRDELSAEAAISHLRQHDIEERATSTRTPFFLMVGLMLPHQPYVARREDFDRYDGRVGMPTVPEPSSEIDDHPFHRWFRRSTGLDGGVPEEVTLRARAAYWAMVDRMDRIVGTILDTLDELGKASETLVVYTSDHGDHVGEHGLWWKQSLLDASAKVPCLLRWPDVIPPGQQLPHVASLLDVNATIIDAMQAPELPRSPGATLLPVLTSEHADWADTAYSEYCADHGQAGGGLGAIDRPHYSRMVRSGSLKLVDHGDEPAQLCDLSTDPNETVNLANDATHEDDVARLTRLVRADWDPEAARTENRVSHAELDIIRSWATNIRPPEVHRWAMKPEYSALDEPESTW